MGLREDKSKEEVRGKAIGTCRGRQFIRVSYSGGKQGELQYPLPPWILGLENVDKGNPLSRRGAG